MPDSLHTFEMNQSQISSAVDQSPFLARLLKAVTEHKLVVLVSTVAIALVIPLLAIFCSPIAVLYAVGGAVVVALNVFCMVMLNSSPVGKFDSKSISNDGESKIKFASIEDDPKGKCSDGQEECEGSGLQVNEVGTTRDPIVDVEVGVGDKQVRVSGNENASDIHIVAEQDSQKAVPLREDLQQKIRKVIRETRAVVANKITNGASEEQKKKLNDILEKMESIVDSMLSKDLTVDKWRRFADAVRDCNSCLLAYQHNCIDAVTESLDIMRFKLIFFDDSLDVSEFVPLARQGYLRNIVFEFLQRFKFPEDDERELLEAQALLSMVLCHLHDDTAELFPFGCIQFLGCGCTRIWNKYQEMRKYFEIEKTFVQSCEDIKGEDGSIALQNARDIKKILADKVWKSEVENDYKSRVSEIIFSLINHTLRDEKDNGFEKFLRRLDRVDGNSNMARSYACYLSETHEFEKLYIGECGKKYVEFIEKYLHSIREYAKTINALGSTATETEKEDCAYAAELLQEVDQCGSYENMEWSLFEKLTLFMIECLDMASNNTFNNEYKLIWECCIDDAKHIRRGKEAACYSKFFEKFIKSCKENTNQPNQLYAD
ncbi:MAG: hypothetical protein LBI69_03985 [Puniceicoccales bacterium]|jgi:hypothetical protein|nr:hypothetical protein [Puniceicoccales bacterium]